MAQPSNTVLAHVFRANEDSQYLATINWQPFRDGVEIYPLYGSHGGMSSAFLRYAPGASVPTHNHVGYEHIFVLQGEQSDEYGTYPQGSIVVNPPSSRHSVRSKEGCIVLVVWEKPVEFFLEADKK